MSSKNKVFSNTVSFKIYSKEVNDYSVLNRTTEKAIKDKYNDPNTTDDERAKLKDMLVEGHLRFALQIANKYAGLGMELDDVIANANVGLVTAVNTYDFKSNNKFITHASYHVRGEVLTALNNNARTIRLPMNVMHKLNREVKEYKENGKEMSDEMVNLPSTTDLHKVIGEDSSLLDVIKNNNAKSTDYDFEFDNLVNYVLSKLDDRSAKVISLLFGLKGKQQDMKEIAAEMDLNVETIRNIKNKALEKLERKLKLI